MTYSYDRRVAGSLRAASDKCLYCGNPKHKGGPTEPISASEGKKIWANRQRSSNGVGENLGLTPAQCETVMKCWEALPDNYTYGSTFTAITKHGSDAILEGRMPARGRRSASELGERVAGVVNRTASGLGTHFKKSLSEIKSGRGISAAQALAQLDDDV